MTHWMNISDCTYILQSHAVTVTVSSSAWHFTSEWMHRFIHTKQNRQKSMSNWLLIREQIFGATHAISPWQKQMNNKAVKRYWNIGMCQQSPPQFVFERMYIPLNKHQLPEYTDVNWCHTYVRGYTSERWVQSNALVEQRCSTYAHLWFVSWLVHTTNLVITL